MSSQIQAAAEALWNARATHAAIAPLREFLSVDALDDAYAIQSLNHRRKLAQGARRIGRKIGLTSLAVQKQLGVEQPDFGVLFDDMLMLGPAVNVPMDRFLQPRIEGEIAFILAEDITVAGMPRAALRRCAGAAAAAFEIVDSAIADWQITLADTVADNASCGAIILGPQRRLLSDFEPKDANMLMTEDGVTVSSGTGAASLGDPLAAFAWLADKALKLDDPLRAGEIVLTGALGPMVPFVRGRRYRLEIAGFDAIEAFVSI
jgi:2-keto-4-pentenoate hydratase